MKKSDEHLLDKLLEKYYTNNESIKRYKVENDNIKDQITELYNRYNLERHVVDYDDEIEIVTEVVSSSRNSVDINMLKEILSNELYNKVVKIGVNTSIRVSSRKKNNKTELKIDKNNETRGFKLPPAR